MRKQPPPAVDIPAVAGSNSSKYTLHYESNGGTSYKDESYSSGHRTVTLDKASCPRELYLYRLDMPTRR